MSRFNLGQFASAEQAFREAIRTGPTRNRYHFWLGFALEREGRLAEARAEYEKELADHPETDTLARERLQALRK
jgi:Flp pilus assembly protein TadD